MSPAHSTTPPPPPRAKRNRLNVACNYCRSRKTRCDAQQPQCRACRLAGVPCVTVDRRQPDAAVQRQPARRQSGAGQAPGSDAGRETGARREPSVGGSPGGGLESGGRGSSVERFQGRLTIFQPQRQHARTLDSVETIVNWLNVALYRLGRSSGAALSASAAPEPPSRIPLRLPTAPQLPRHETCDALFTAFFATANLLYPIVNKARITAARAFAQTHGLDHFVEHHGLAPLMQIYLILVLGASYKPQLLQRAYVDELRDYCKTLQGHVLAYNSLDTVSAAVLMTLQYIFVGEETAAWAMLIQTCAMATTMGIRAPSVQSRPGSGGRRLSDLEYGERVWWALYCLEKQYAFELGRSSNILELPRDYPAMDCAADDVLGQEDAAFVFVTSLARTLHEISAACTSVGEREERSVGAEALRGAIVAKVTTTGECVALLGEWMRNLPAAYRPTSDSLYIDKMSDLSVYASMQYHHALLMLCRNSLLLAEEAIHEATEVIAKGQPWELLVRHGQTIVANAARKILTLTVEGADHEEGTLIPTLLISLHAIIVLYVYGVRHPGARMKPVDQALISSALTRVEELLDRVPCDRGSMHSALEAFRNIFHQPSNTPPASMSAIPDGTRIAAAEPPVEPSNLSQGLVTPADYVSMNDRFIPVNRVPPSRDQIWGGNEVHPTQIDGGFPLDELTYASAFADQIGWDWSAFSQLLSIPGSPGDG